MSQLINAQAAFLLDAAKLIQKAQELGFVATAGELWRPDEMQAIYVKSGRSKTMDSQHGKRLAIDLNIFLNGVLCTREQIEPLGKWWESLTPLNRWGGSWRGLVEAKKSSFVDAPHFERQLA
jgi:hypothetical protein